MSEKKNEYPAVYRQSRDYAREHGEIPAFRDSFRMNIACKNAIETAVRENFDGMHLSADAVKPVLEQYGAERVGYVLANTIQEKAWDGRFSHRNKEWAAGISIAENTVMGENRNREFAVDSHPTILDGFVSMFRDELRERTEKRESVLGQLDAMKQAAPAHPSKAAKYHEECR